MSVTSFLAWLYILYTALGAVVAFFTVLYIEQELSRKRFG